MIELGGSIFIHNGIEFDYCFKESILSLYDYCDEVLVLDAESTDNTLEELYKLKKNYNLKNLIISEGHKWECNRWNDKGYDRLAVLANKAKSMLDCKWHLMLQADEVIHENSIPFIRKIIKDNKNNFDAYLFKRINLYYNMEHYIRHDCSIETCGVGKPCSDLVWRLAHKNIDAKGDAEHIGGFLKGNNNYYNDLIIFHYGYVRKPDSLLKKANEMLDWFWKKGGHSDPILIEHEKKYGYFIPEEKMPESSFTKLQIPHPKYSQNYVKERREIFNKLEKLRGRNE